MDSLLSNISQQVYNSVNSFLFGEIFLDRFMFDHETVSILHYSIYNLPHAMLCLYQNCWLMTIGLVHTTLNSLSYSAATAIIRYVYVRSSLQANRQEVLKRNAFIFKAIFIVEIFEAMWKPWTLWGFFRITSVYSGFELHFRLSILSKNLFISSLGWYFWT